MGCGASKNDVIKSASGSGNEPKPRESGGASTGDEANGDAKTANGNNSSCSSSIADLRKISTSSQDSLNCSLVSEGSTIPASEKFGNGSATGGGTSNGNNNDIRSGTLIDNSGSSGNSRKIPELPPLKPSRTSRVGFLDQTTDDATAMASEAGKSCKEYILIKLFAINKYYLVFYT